MKLNKVSSVLRKQGKGALYASAMLSMLAAPSYAIAAEEAAADDVEVIEVRGMRGTMTRSLNEKKNTSAIVDAIAAADFGELPGLSLSDVIENVSGASGHRLKGSQNEISIRGLGSYWGYATFNGRTITNAGPGRAVNFKKFPSDLVDKVVIYKSQQADLVEGGTAGTIEVSSLRPVDYGKSSTTIQVAGIYNSYFDDVESSGNTDPWGTKFVFSTAQSWDSEALGGIGFTFGASIKNTANPEELFTGSSTQPTCATKLATGEYLTIGEKCETGTSGITNGKTINEEFVKDVDGQLHVDEDALAKFDPATIFYTPTDSSWRTVEDKDKRESYVATFQWVPNDMFDINFDYELSRLDNEEDRLELQLADRRSYLDTSTMLIAPDHTVLYQEGRSKMNLHSEARSQIDEYDGYGLSVDFTPTDDLKLSLDYSFSKSYRYRTRLRSKIKGSQWEDYSLDFRNSNAPVLTFLGDSAKYFDPSNILSYQDYDGLVNVMEDDLDANGQQQLDGEGNVLQKKSLDELDQEIFERNYLGYFNGEFRRDHEERDDEIKALRLDLEYSLDNDYISSVKAGVRVSEEHLLDFKSNEVSYNPFNGNEIGGVYKFTDALLEDNSAFAAAFSDNCMKDHQNNNFLQDEAGNGGDANQYVTFDAECFAGTMYGTSDEIQAAKYAEAKKAYELANPGLNFKDSDEPLAQWESTEGKFYTKNADGSYNYIDIGERTQGLSGDDIDVTEKITAAYVMAEIDAEIVGIPVTGNVGVRVVHTDTHSDGVVDVLYVEEYTQENIRDLIIDGTYTDETAPAVGSFYHGNANKITSQEELDLDSDYTEVLPSLNLSWHISDEFILRTSAYRALSRFQMNAMASGISYEDTCESVAETICDETQNTNKDDIVLGISAKGNHLDPYLSNNYDLSFEYYPSQDMALTLALYYKQFQGGYETQVVARPETPVFIVNGVNESEVDEAAYANATPYNIPGVATTVSNTSDDESIIKGFELTYQQAFVDLPGILSGLGAKFAWNRAWSDFVTQEPVTTGLTPDANLFGFSKDTASGSVYWEGDALTLRLMYKYRSKYFQPNGLPFPNRTNRWVQDAEYLSASAKYKLMKGVSLQLKATNLLDEPQLYTRGSDTSIAEYSRSGAKFEFGVKVKF